MRSIYGTPDGDLGLPMVGTDDAVHLLSEPFQSLPVKHPRLQR